MMSGVSVKYCNRLPIAIPCFLCDNDIRTIKKKFIKKIQKKKKFIIKKKKIHITVDDNTIKSQLTVSDKIGFLKYKFNNIF
jgi:hypothetical protein